MKEKMLPCGHPLAALWVLSRAAYCSICAGWSLEKREDPRPTKLLKALELHR